MPRWPLSPHDAGDADQYCLYPRAAYAAGQRSLQRQQSLVLSFTRGLQEEFADSGVRIQAVLPAATATDLWPTSGVALDALPSGTVMTTEDLVDAALRGLEMGNRSPYHRFMTWDCGRLLSSPDWRCLPVREPDSLRRGIDKRHRAAGATPVAEPPSGYRSPRARRRGDR